VYSDAMAITLTPELEAIAKEGANLAGYDSAETYVAERLAESYERDRFLVEHHDELVQMLNEGLDEIDCGETVTAEEAKRDIAEWKKEFLAARPVA
jgi:hypothetical protein